MSVPTPRGTPAAAEKMHFFGVPVDAIDRASLVATIHRCCLRRERLHVATISVHFVSLARVEPQFLAALRGADLAVADGRLLWWAARLAGSKAPEQITGHDLFHDCARLAHRCGFRVFLLGGAPGVAAQVAARLRGQFRGLAVQSAQGGQFERNGRNRGQAATLQAISAFNPHLLFVALGAPKQENWIAEHLPRLPACVAIGIGGVFDTVAGRLPRAPRWMQVSGLESVFQLAVAPRRYGVRYLFEDPPTLLKLIAQAIAKRRCPTSDHHT